jgi:hypothetical protein
VTEVDGIIQKCRKKNGDDKFNNNADIRHDNNEINLTNIN